MNNKTSERKTVQTRNYHTNMKSNLRMSRAGSRRNFLRQTAIGVAAVPFGKAAFAGDPKAPAAAGIAAGANRAFASLKQLDAGVLNVGYAEDGPANGPVAILLHGWPYDIY